MNILTQFEELFKAQGIIREVMLNTKKEDLKSSLLEIDEKMIMTIYSLTREVNTILNEIEKKRS